jgi:hypothetical protein
LFNGGKGPVEPLFGFSHPPGSVISISNLGRKGCVRRFSRQRRMHLTKPPADHPGDCFTVAQLEL